MITSENILYVGTLVLVVYLGMNSATNYPNRDTMWVKLLSFSTSDTPSFARIIYNLGKMVMLVGFGLQLFNIAFWFGLVIFIPGLIITFIARNQYNFSNK